MPKEKIYFASDFHLGVPDRKSSLERELKFVQWLNNIEPHAKAIYLMGDIFDFWFEYKNVIPKGYTRLLGKLAALADSGVEVHLFKGNHDLWAFGYLQEECGIQLHRKDEVIEMSGKKFYLAHGDGLGTGDSGYKFLKSIFENKLAQFLFRWLHPDIGTRMGLYFSRRSRYANIIKEHKKENPVNIADETLVRYAYTILDKHPDIEYFVFGHRHIPVIFELNNKSKCVILGDWLTYFTYAQYDGNTLEIKTF